MFFIFVGLFELTELTVLLLPIAKSRLNQQKSLKDSTIERLFELKSAFSNSGLYSRSYRAEENSQGRESHDDTK